MNETSPSSGNKKPKPEILINLIKEDRNEIRIIKNRVYTYVQALAVAAFAITAFLFKDGEDSWSIEWMVIGINVVFLALSWAVVGVQYLDLRFVRRCIRWRECQLTKFDADYFGIKKECKFSAGNKCQNSSKLLCSAHFANDYLLFGPVALLTLVYIAVIVWATCLLL